MEELILDQLVEISNHIHNIEKDLTLLVSTVIIAIIVSYIYRFFKDIKGD